MPNEVKNGGQEATGVVGTILFTKNPPIDLILGMTDLQVCVENASFLLANQLIIDKVIAFFSIKFMNFGPYYKGEIY